MQIEAAQFLGRPLCSIFRFFLKCHVSSARPWLWFPRLGPTEQRFLFRSTCLGPVLMKDMSLISPRVIQTLVLNLICAAKKTYCSRCVLKGAGDLVQTAPWTVGNKRITWVTYCMLYLKTHKQTKKLLMSKNIPAVWQTCGHQHQRHVRVSCDALGSLCSNLPLCHQLKKDSLRERGSMLGAAKEGIQRHLAKCWRAASVWPASQTENSDPPRRPWVSSSKRRRRRPVNGLHHSRDGGPPNTVFIPSHLMRRSHVGFSFLRRSISCKTKITYYTLDH